MWWHDANADYGHSYDTISLSRSPFDVMKGAIATGFDAELMRAVCGRLSLELRPLSAQLSMISKLDASASLSSSSP